MAGEGVVVRHNVLLPMEWPTEERTTMVGERITTLLGKMGDAIATAEGLVTRFDEVLEDIDDVVEHRLEEIRSALARLQEQFTELEAELEGGQEDLDEGDVVEVP